MRGIGAAGVAIAIGLASSVAAAPRAKAVVVLVIVSDVLRGDELEASMRKRGLTTRLVQTSSNTLAGLRAAFTALRASRARTKHVIVVSSAQSPYDGIPALAEEMRAAGITISAIGFTGADRNLLSMIADRGTVARYRK